VTFERHHNNTSTTSHVTTSEALTNSLTKEITPHFYPSHWISGTCNSQPLALNPRLHVDTPTDIEGSQTVHADSMPTPEQRNERPYVNGQNLPQSTNEYVGWFDVMATQATLSRSIQRGANFFIKIHLAALRVRPNGVSIYPVMDGIYFTAQTRQALQDFLHDFYRLHSIVFCSETDNQLRYLIRGSVAYGPVIHGRDIGPNCADFGADPAYRNTLLLGMPMIQASQSERQAPPMGVFIHESARAFAPNHSCPLPYSWHKWWRDEDQSLVDEMKAALSDYFTWCRSYSRLIDYPPDKISEHLELARQYYDIK
jgi:hypothetical protein